MDKRLNDKIRGALYGCAYGDALGFGTEFMTKPEIRKHYPGGLRSLDRIINDCHRCQWPRREWTHDTDILLMVLESGIDKGCVEIHDVCRRLQEWALGNVIDLAPAFLRVLKDPEWPGNPIEKAVAHWAKGDLEANNGSIQRTVAAAFISGDDTFEEDARNLVRITHDDTRCEVTGLLAAKMARSLLFEDTPADYDEMVETARTNDPRVIPYLDMAHNGELYDLDLDDEDTLAYTRKCMASAFWTVWHCDNAADAIHCLVDEGGDSDTNAALAGTFAGLRYGFDAIPDEKLNLHHRERLDDMAERLTEHVGKILCKA